MKNASAYIIRLENHTYAYIIRRMNALRHIRKNVFKVTQAEFAELAGVKQSSVSRWENGVGPSLEEMQAIRKAAVDRNLGWDDAYFFEAPISEAAE
jgi:transcriptional regulator with XRE-family HTH domain